MLGDYWYFMKQREYKNFKYNLKGSSCESIYFLCKYRGGCYGRLHYNKGFSITEQNEHDCVDRGKVIDMMACNPL